MPPLKLRKPITGTPRPATNWWTGRPVGAPEPPSDAEVAAMAAGQAALAARRTPQPLRVGFAPGSGVVPPQALLDRWNEE